MKPPTLHRHRKNFGTPIDGCLLETGDILEVYDVYESSNGFWERCPCPGLTLVTGTEPMWVRPTEFVARETLTALIESPSNAE